MAFLPEPFHGPLKLIQYEDEPIMALRTRWGGSYVNFERNDMRALRRMMDLHAMYLERDEPLADIDAELAARRAERRRVFLEKQSEGEAA